MAYGSSNASQNPYFAARKEAAKYNDRLSSRESAAELLGVSPSTLADYELDLTKCMPPDRVCAMADLYNAPELKGMFCLNECPIGKGLPLAGRVKALEQVAIQLTRRLDPQALGSVRDRLLAVAEDGVIDEGEKPAMRAIVSTLNELQQSISDLRLLAEKYCKEA